MSPQEKLALILYGGTMEKYGKVLWRNMVRCVPPGNMISPPAANLIARNGEEIRGWSTVSQFIRVPAECIGGRFISAHCHSALPLSRGTTGHKGLFFQADPRILCLRQNSFSCFQISFSGLLPRISFFLVAVSVRVEAKTSFESPVSALHAEAFVAAQILLNMRHDHRERENRALR